MVKDQSVKDTTIISLKYFSPFAAVKIGKKLFLPIFTAAKDEKYFRKM